MIVTQTNSKIFEQLAKAQAEFDSITKNKTVKESFSKTGNKFGGYAYADLSTVLDAILPALNRHGLFLSQNPVIQNEDFCLTTSIANADGDVLQLGNVNYHIAGLNPQELGKTITYLRRYSLLACFGLATEDDDAIGVSKNFDTTKTKVMSSSIKSAQSIQKSLEANNPNTVVLNDEVAKYRTVINSLSSIEALSKYAEDTLKNLDKPLADLIRPHYVQKCNELKSQLVA